LQLADRTPFAGGPLDPHLVRMRLCCTLYANKGLATHKCTFAGHQYQASTLSNMRPEADGVHWPFWYASSNCCLTHSLGYSSYCLQPGKPELLLCRVHQAGAASVPYWVYEANAADPPSHLQALFACPSGCRRPAQVSQVRLHNLFPHKASGLYQQQGATEAKLLHVITLLGKRSDFQRVFH